MRVDDETEAELKGGVMRRSSILVLCSALAAPLVWSPNAVAADTPADVSARQRALFQKGIRLYDQSRWAEARAAFLEAWALEKSYAVAANLGDVELIVGDPRSAAEHLSYALRELPAGGKPAQRKLLTERLKEAQRFVGALRIQVTYRATVGQSPEAGPDEVLPRRGDEAARRAPARVTPPEAEVLVGGKPLPVEGAADEIYLEPGTHRVTARRDGYAEAEKVVTVAAGTRREVTLALVERPTTSAAGTAKLPETAVVWPARSAEEYAGRPRRAVLIGGAVTMGAAVVAGVGFTGLSNSKAADADALAAELARDGGSSACWSRTTPTCAALHDLNTESDTFHDLAVAGFVGAGVVGAATLVYWLWPRARTETRVAPVIGASVGGVVMSGRF
ncbi:PEGA domain-containing protein [Sorangium sp. So ce204]|uniref:PEGA domain-containing protein n=1 Tax=Sorangium sp. So ce204 TaxID=3133288 RepID=UPI003F5EF24E